MTWTKRGIIRICCFAAAIFTVLIIRNLMLMSEVSQNRRTLGNTYSRAVEELADAVENVNETLEKELYAGSAQMHKNLAVKLYREASSAKAALSQLPIAELNLENTYKFLSQIGNYSLSISKKLENDEKLTDEEYSNILSLYNFSDKLSSDMWELEGAVSSGEISLDNTSAYAQEDTPPTVTDGFSDFEEGFDDYPTLIYDGPFSDNIMEKTPKMTSSAENVSQEKALERCSMALNMLATDFNTVDDVAGKMPGWRFSDNNQTISCEVTKSGGYISYFLKAKSVNEEKISKEYALKCAGEFLDYLGILSMKTTYYDVENGIMTVNYAYNDVGTCVYTDLVKVSVAMDSGEIVGYDARGFLVNHYDRKYSENLFSKSRAEELVSPQLAVKSSQLAVIPTDNLEEKLCYEFKCTAKNGRNVLVYINAETGEEEQILMLVESETGTLSV